MIHITRCCSALNIAATAEGANCDVTAAAGMMSSVTQKCGIAKAEFQISACNSRNCRNIAEITDFFKTLLLLQFLFDHSEIFTAETRHIVPA